MTRFAKVLFLLFGVLLNAMLVSHGICAATVAPGQINLLLTWKDSSDGEDGFAIERATSPKGPWTRIGTVAANTTSFLDTNLKGWAAYYYRVFAFKEDDHSDYSNIAGIVTPRYATLPMFRGLPASRSASAGSDAVLSANASGTPPLTYQWRFSGTNLDGETNSQLVLRAVRPDQAGNYSVVVGNANGATLSYPMKLAVTSRLKLRVNGWGGIWPNLDGQELEIGRRYAVRAYPQAGNAFQGWVTNGTATRPYPILSFVMEPNLVIKANFVDLTRPLIAITSPRPNARIATNLLTMKGLSRDNARVSEVKYQLNGGEWLTAAGTVSWQAQVSLTPGRNTLRACCVDATGNCSVTNAQYVTYVVNTPLVVQTKGKGVVSPNYNGRLLEIGQTYSMTAWPGKGFVFTNWSFGTNEPVTTLTGKPTALFQMQSNLIMQANFVDVQRPTIVITNSLPKGQVGDPVAQVRGTAADNDRVAAVMCQLNGGSWTLADGTNFWLTSVQLVSGTNTLRAYSVDATGNMSVTNAITSVVTVLQPAISNFVVEGNQAALSLQRAAGAVVLFRPVISDFVVEGSRATLSVQSDTGAVYRLEYKGSLADAEWTALAPAGVPGSGGLLRLTDFTAPAAGRFYRVRAEFAR